MVYKPFFPAMDAETQEQIMLLRCEIFTKTNPVIPFNMVVEKVILDTNTMDFKMQNGEEAFQNYLKDRINIKVDLTYNIED